MKKIVCFCCVVIASILFHNITVAQTQKHTPHFSAIFTYGASFGDSKHWFLDDVELKLFPVKPMFAYSAGIQYGPIIEIYGAYMLPSLEIGFGSTKTNTSIIKPSSIIRFNEKYLADHAIQRIPVMLWMTITTETKLTPYVRFGMGISNTRFMEVYSYESIYYLRFQKWALTWGIGGGIQYTLSNELVLALFLDDWITNVEMKEKVPKYSTKKGIEDPFKITVVGIKTVINFMTN